MGKRGPKPIAKARTFVGTIFPDALLRRVDRHARRERVGRSEAIRDLLERALAKAEKAAEKEFE
jgi:metal-responsive CopG/Arc/MetJ family transcriptional regulator